MNAELSLTQIPKEKQMMKIQKFNKGFTLVELMVTLAISSLVMSGIYAVFHKQVATHNTERLVVSMQQNARAAMSFMERDIRMARYDPSGSSGANILIADRAQLQFQIDDDGDGVIAGAQETITYDLDNDAAPKDGIADGTLCNLVRDNGSGVGAAIVARSIDALNFDYFDADGTSILDRTATPWQVPAGQIADIQSIRVSIVARSGDSIPVLFINHTDAKIYRNRSGDTILPAQNNDFRRMQVTTEIDCRN
jgi:type IV pilus assembly protein PilW